MAFIVALLLALTGIAGSNWECGLLARIILEPRKENSTTSSLGLRASSPYYIRTRQIVAGSNLAFSKILMISPP